MVNDIQPIDSFTSLITIADRTSFIDLKRAIKRNNGGEPTSRITDIVLTSIFYSSPQAGGTHDGADALGPGDPHDNLRDQVEPVRAQGE